MVDYTTELFYDGVWNDITSDVRDSDPIVMSRGRKDWSSVTDPATCTLKLNNGTSRVAPSVSGRYSPRNPRSDLFGKIGRNTPVRTRVGAVVRFTGEMTTWPVRWDLSGADVWVKALASGILRRLQRGTKPLHSAPYRFTTTASNVAAYWPLERGNLLTEQLAAVIGSHPWQPLSGASEFGAGELAPWLPDGVSMGTNSATMLGNVTMSRTPTRIVVDHLRRSFDGGSGPSVLDIVGNGADGGTHWIITFTPSLNLIEIQLNTDGSFSFFDDTTTDVLSNGDTHHIRFQAVQSGTSVNWTLYVDGTSVFSGTETSTTLSGVAQVRMSYTPGTAQVPLAFGHVTVWSGTSTLSSVVDAAFGHTGETAGNRMDRLTTEEDILFSSVGSLSNTAVMGPQSPLTTIELLRECERVDMGMLYDDPTAIGLEYRTRENLYAQTPTLTLDYTDGVISQPFYPMDDDQGIRNDITVDREGGSEYNVQETTGPVSVQNPPDGVGKYDYSETLNVATDSQLPNQAFWRLHLGTIDEARFPILKLNVRNTRVAAMITDIGAVGLGDIIRIDNPPDWLPGGPYLLMVEAIEEEKTAVTHEIQFTCSPGNAWDVATWQGSAEIPAVDEGNRYDTGGSELAGSLTTTATTLSVSTTLGPVWTSDVSGVDLAGTGTSNAGTPDDASLDIIGDIDIRCDFTPDAWPPAMSSMVAKYNTSGNQRSYRLYLESDGTLKFAWSADGTTVLTATSTAVLPLRAGQRLAVRVTLDVNNGAAGNTTTFYVATRGSGPFTQFGAAIVKAGTTSIFSGTANLYVGAHGSGSSNPFAGVVHGVQIRNTIGGAIRANPMFNEQIPGTTSFVDSTGKTWTMTGSTIEAANSFDIDVGGETMRVLSIEDDVSPQAFRVTRSLNGVVKTHASGTSVKLAYPSYYGI